MLPVAGADCPVASITSTSGAAASATVSQSLFLLEALNIPCYSWYIIIVYMEHDFKVRPLASAAILQIIATASSKSQSVELGFLCSGAVITVIPEFECWRLFSGLFRAKSTRAEVRGKEGSSLATVVSREMSTGMTKHSPRITYQA